MIRQQTAICLLDHLIALFLFGSLLGLASVTLPRMVSRFRLERTIRSFSHELNASAQIAVSRGIAIAITYDNNRHSFVVSHLHQHLHQSAKTPPQYSKIFPLHKSIRLTNFRFGNLGAQTLVFRENGSATPGTITLGNDRGDACSVVQTLRSARRIVCIPA